MTLQLPSQNECPKNQDYLTNVTALVQLYCLGDRITSKQDVSAFNDAQAMALKQSPIQQYAIPTVQTIDDLHRMQNLPTFVPEHYTVYHVITPYLSISKGVAADEDGFFHIKLANKSRSIYVRAFSESLYLIANTDRPKFLTARYRDWFAENLVFEQPLRGPNAVTSFLKPARTDDPDLFKSEPWETSWHLNRLWFLWKHFTVAAGKPDAGRAISPADLLALLTNSTVQVELQQVVADLNKIVSDHQYDHTDYDVTLVNHPYILTEHLLTTLPDHMPYLFERLTAQTTNHNLALSWLYLVVHTGYLAALPHTRRVVIN